MLGGLAIAGILVYLALDVALVFLRPQFSVLHNAESDYGSSGPYAWAARRTGSGGCTWRWRSSRSPP
jgi:predicted secreted protein